MFKNLLSAVGWGELPSSFGFSVGEKIDLAFSWHWELHKGAKKSDGSAVSVFVCAKKDLDSQQVSAAKNAVQMAKGLRHTNIIRALDSIEVEGGFYLVTEEVMPLLSPEAVDADEKKPAVWGLFQVLDGLSFLHQSGFTHGLFGPSAVFVTKKGEYRLGAFELCRKGADAQSIIAQRRRCSPGVLGWPDPPSCLLEGSAPTVGVDLWGAAVMMAFVFSSARSGARGTDVRIDMTRASQDLPPELRKPFADLSKPGPLRGRNPIADVCQLAFFQEDAAVRVMGFLGSLHIKSSDEKDGFFDALPGMLDTLPTSLQTKQLLPELLEAQKFPGQEAAQVLPAILKIGTRTPDGVFKEKIAPLVAQLFAAPDRAVRFRLLTSLGEMIDLLDDVMINDKIFPECVNGFTDSNGPIREATVKSLIHFVPRLRAKTVENRVTKLLVKLMADPEASIRTNAVICSGRLSSHLPKQVANQTLVTVLASGFKDPFAPCRNASLQTLMACSSLFSAEELSMRLMPGVCQRLVDNEASVADTAFNVLTSLQQNVRQMVEERRESSGQEPVLEAATGDGKEAGGWSSWAMSTVGSVVGDKLMGTMGRPKSESSGNLASAGGTPSSQPPPPPQASEGHSGTTPSAPSRAPARGMTLGSGPAAAAPAPPAAADGWGDDDLGEDLVAADGEAWGGDGGGGGENFWEDFGDVPEGMPKQQEPPASAPADRRAAGAAAAPAPAPKAKALPAKVSSTAVSSKEDEDFWKEFDM